MIRKHVRYCCACVLLLASTACASDLSDGMQMFFDGKYQDAQQKLSAMLAKGQHDPRIYYYRGLTLSRLGNLEAAVADFKKGAQLEAQGVNAGVGQALQRVQGGDRLMLEKHRTLARLAARHRVQPTAPKPIANQVKLTTATVPASVPLFRLASEVPIRSQIALDRLADDSISMLAREHIPGGPSPIKPQTANTQQPSAEAPVGTGVALANESATDFNPFDDVVDPSSASANDLSSADEVAGAASARTPKTTGVFGAVFRALTKSVVPRVDTLLPPGVVPQAQPQPAPFDVGDDIFGEGPDGGLEEGDLDGANDAFDDF